MDIHIGASFFKQIKKLNNSELLPVFILFSNAVSNVKCMMFIKRKIDLEDAGIYIEFPWQACIL